MPGPLSGIRVLDLCQLAVGPYGASLLGQLGAQVIKIEEPNGDPIRNLLPEQQGVGTYYTSVNQNKLNIALNLKNPDDLAIAVALAERADVIIENFRPGAMDRAGMGYDAIKAINPDIVYCSSSGYGNGGPRRLEGSADGYARSFTAFDASNGPVGNPHQRFRSKGHIDHTCSTFVTQTALAGLAARARYGIGQKVETSMMQATMVYQTSRIAEYFANGEQPPSLGSATSNLVPHQAFASRDGHVAIGVNTQAQWRNLCAGLQLDEIVDDPRFHDNAARVAHRDELVERLSRVIATKSTQEWVDAFVPLGVPCGPFLTFADLWQSEQVQANQMIVDVAHPWGDTKVGGTPWKFTRTEVQISRAPGKDENREEILRIIAEEPPRRERRLTPAPALPTAGPLEGVKVLDISQGIAGPFTAMQLGDLGADVTKVEPPDGDWSRTLAPPSQGSEGPVFVALNRNKSGAVLDIRDETRREELLGRIAEADVLVTDLLPAEAERLGLTYDVLSRDHPGLIMCSVSPFGERGPWRDRAGGEIVLQAMGDIWRYLSALDQAPLRLAADAAAMAGGIFGTQGVVAAVIERERSGLGQKVEVSHLGALMAIETQLHAAQSNPDLKGGWHLSAPTDPPEYDLRTQDLGIEFGFMARRVGGWEEFCKRIGVPDEIANDERFNSALGRTLNWPAFRAAFEPYSTRYSASDLKAIIEECGGVGVICNSYETLFADPQVAAFDMLREIDHPTLGRVKTLGLPWNLEKTPGSIRSASPVLKK